MCRMVVLIDDGDLVNLRGHIHSSLVKASRHDPYLKELYGDYSHSDGWGVLVVEVGEALRYNIFKSMKPIYHDDISVLNSRRSSKAIEVLHVRAASRGTPINIHSTHPLETLTSQGYRLLLAHNGSVDKERLARDTRSTEGEFKLYNDSYFLAKMIATRIGDDIVESLKKALRESIDYVKSALNISLTLIASNQIYQLTGSYYRTDVRDEMRRLYHNYYKMYYGVIGESRIYVSSTLVDYYKPDFEIEWIELENGEYHLYEVRGSTIKLLEVIRIS